MTLSVLGHVLRMLLDSRASHDFISADAVKQLGLRLRSAAWSHVTLADGGKQDILGQVTLRLKVGPLKLVLQPYVLPALSDGLSYILGSATLEQYSGVLDYRARCLRLRKGSLSCKLAFGAGSSDRSNGQLCCSSPLPAH